MTEQEKPLHVRVAEALGWRGCKLVGYFLTNPPQDCWQGKPPESKLVGPEFDEFIPRYDVEWYATGPLVEKYGFNLGPLNHADWEAASYSGDFEARGLGPLQAVCFLILKLDEAGKLKEQEL